MIKDHDIKVTVLMPAYNADKYIAEAISSVLNQTFRHFELLIINDGSTDNTEKVIRSFNDDRIVLINQDNLGIALALNKGLQFAKAPYIARFDADDICHPNRLEIQYNYMMMNPDCIIMGSDADYIDMNGNFVFTYNPPAYSNNDIRDLGYKHCPFVHASVIYKKDVILESGGYNPYAYSFEDHLLWTVVMDKGSVCNLSLPLLKVRLNPGSITIDETWRSSRFREIKYNAIRSKQINAEEGNELLKLLKEQEQPRMKEGSYHALLGKKFLWDNYQPLKARENIKKAISYHPGNAKSYFLLFLSFLPEKLIRAIYNLSKQSKKHTAL